jgi:Carboxypeptidase regulatory-like domain
MLSKLSHVRLTGVAFLWLACVATSLAQSSGTGALTGTVSDPSGAVVAGATVTLTNNNTGQVRMITTASDGTYRFALIPPGNYKVQFAASDFKVAEVPSVTVNVSETPVLNQALEVGQ